MTLGLSLSYSDLKGRVTVSAVDDTQVMKVTGPQQQPRMGPPGLR